MGTGQQVQRFGIEQPWNDTIGWGQMAGWHVLFERILRDLCGNRMQKVQVELLER